MSLETISEQRCFDGVQGFYRHHSHECGVAMRFSVFQPPQAAAGRVPVLYFLAGLTCNEETFAIKAGAQRLAAALGVMIVAPDTSPRDTGIGGESDDWEFGAGAGFYVDATQPPWSRHFRMYSYLATELPELVVASFPADTARCGIFGHSMGGHGALVLGLRNPGRFRSLSAFAPIVAPSRVPWGMKALPRYLGPAPAEWADYDAVELVKRETTPSPILLDQGLDDQYLSLQLRPELFEEACTKAGQPLKLRRHAGYDHSYYFVASFVEDHLRHHMAVLDG